MSETTMRFVIAATGDQAEKAIGHFGMKMGEVTKGFIKNGLEIAGAFAAITAVKDFVSGSVEAASQAEISQAQLTTAVKNSGNQMSAFTKPVEEADASMRKYGFTNAQTHTALATLTIGLKDPAKALKVLGVAADLAKAKNMDLNSAALLVTKGMEGQIRPLKALGIDLPVYTGNAQAVAVAQNHLVDAQRKVTDILAKTPDAVNASSKAHAAYQVAVDGVTKAQAILSAKQSSGDQILGVISDRMKGSAAAAADTYAGKTAAMAAQWDNVKEKAGAVLLPALSTVVEWLAKTGLPAVQHFADGWNGVAGAIGNAANAGKDLRSFMNDWNTFWDQSGKNIKSVFTFVPNALTGAGTAANTAFKNSGNSIGNQRYYPGTNVVNRNFPSNALGGTYAPQAGGHIVRLAEAGRAETIVDTASLNRAVNSRPANGGHTFNMYGVTDLNGTALAVMRRINLARS
jgi:hypothetical protein